MDPAGGGAETSISAAIARASDGDTIIVHSGTYNENVHINKQLKLTGIDTGGGRPVVDGHGLVELFDVTITASNVMLQGFSICNGSVGVAIGDFGSPLTGITVYNNWVHNTSGESIGVQFANGTNITGNIVSKSRFGIGIGSHNNKVSDNIVSGMTEYGITVAYSGNTITGNTVNGCGEAGIEILGSAAHVYEANNADGNTVYDCTMGIYVSGSGNILEGNEVFGNDDGLYIHEAYDGRITDNVASENHVGLKLLTSRNNSITGNTFRENAHGAIIGDETIDSNTIQSNSNVINGITASLQPPRPTYIAEPVPSGQPSAPISLVKPSPSAQPPVPAPTEGGGESVVQTVGALIQNWLVIAIAALVLGIISIVVLLILFVSWDERRHER